MQLSFPNAFLAILSACQTARGDDTQPDQAVHLAATMLFLGFKSVLATMWYVLCSWITSKFHRTYANTYDRSMNDNLGTHITKTIYQHLYAKSNKQLDPSVVAFALDEAVQQLRYPSGDGELPLPSTWAPFIHIGL